MTALTTAQMQQIVQLSLGSSTVTYTRQNSTVSGQTAMYLIPSVTLSGYLVMYHHGVGENEDALLTDPLKTSLTAALLAAGHLLCGSNAHANNFGNQNSINDYIALYNDSVSRFGTLKVIFIGQSMGGLSSLLCIADGTIPVKGWVGIYPSCNLANMFGSNAAPFAPTIRAAFGIAADGSDYSSKTSGYDPVLKSGALFTIPMRFYASSGDTTVNKAANTDTMQALVAATTPEETIVACTGNHGDPSHFQPSDVLSFISRCT